MASGAFEVERHVPAYIDDVVSWQRGAAEAQWRLHAVLRVLRARGGGTVWHPGGVDGNPSERLRFGLTP
jgi:hypothetical protein